MSIRIFPLEWRALLALLFQLTGVFLMIFYLYRYPALAAVPLKVTRFLIDTWFLVICSLRLSHGARFIGADSLARVYRASGWKVACKFRKQFSITISSHALVYLRPRNDAATFKSSNGPWQHPNSAYKLAPPKAVEACALIDAT